MTFLTAVSKISGFMLQLFDGSASFGGRLASNTQNLSDFFGNESRLWLKPLD